MRRLWPAADLGPLSDDELARAYAYPDGLRRPYLRVNFVASADGATTVRGVSGGLSSAPDRRVFGLLRRLAEVILVGAETVRTENYRGARKPSLATGVPPRIAVVTASAELDPGSPLFTDTSVPPLIMAAGGAPPEKLRRLAEAGAEVVTMDDELVTPAALLAALDTRGLRRVLCEGGSRLFGQLIAAGA
ncbi:MAG: dihydrofolate reductase family protein, partial [Pseudonocardia sp.]|nr:dihydrofolate reductase family protein [Pseudonocardia sp.]